MAVRRKGKGGNEREREDKERSRGRRRVRRGEGMEGGELCLDFLSEFPLEGEEEEEE